MRRMFDFFFGSSFVFSSPDEGTGVVNLTSSRQLDELAILAGGGAYIDVYCGGLCRRNVRSRTLAGIAGRSLFGYT